MDNLVKTINQHYALLIEMFRYYDYFEQEDKAIEIKNYKDPVTLQTRKRYIYYENPGIYTFATHPYYLKYQTRIDDYLNKRKLSLEQLCRYVIVGILYERRMSKYHRFFSDEKLIFILPKPETAFERKKWLKFYIFNMIITFYRKQKQFDSLEEIRFKFDQWYDFVIHNQIIPKP